MLEGYRLRKVNNNKFVVDTPRGEHYTLTNGDQPKCSCTGFKYRRKCKHLNLLPVEKIRHPRSVVDEAIKKLGPIFDVYSQRWEVVGSYRRGLKDIKDIDVLIRCEPVDFLKIGNELAARDDFESIMGGPDIFRGYVNGVMIDLSRVEKGEWVTYLLYRTGSVANNIKMRAKAKYKGWALNEHGLFDSSGKKFSTPSEKSVYKWLDIPYLEPHQR